MGWMIKAVLPSAKNPLPIAEENERVPGPIWTENIYCLYRNLISGHCSRYKVAFPALMIILMSINGSGRLTYLHVGDFFLSWEPEKSWRSRALTLYRHVLTHGNRIATRIWTTPSIKNPALFCRQWPYYQSCTFPDRTERFLMLSSVLAECHWTHKLSR